MKLRSLAHAAQQHLQSACAVPVRRSHVHELIAAAFGYGSWAAFKADSFLADAGVGTQPLQGGGITGRALQLGYPSEVAATLSSQLFSFVQGQGLCALRCDVLLSMLKGLAVANSPQRSASADGEFDDDDSWLDLEDEAPRILERPVDGGISASAMLLDELAGTNFDPQRHYLLALVLRCPKPNPYLHEESLKGRVLTAIERRWVEQYLRCVPRYLAYEHHLRSAAVGGVREAAAAYAEAFDRPDFFELAQRQTGEVDPMRMAAMARTSEERKPWLRKAAEQGSDEAMAWLASEGDLWAMEGLARDGDESELRELARRLAADDDGLRAWALQYFALSHGTDLSRDDYHAYHSEGVASGQLYDDDVGGPLFVDGEDAVNLPEIDDTTQRHARRLAKAFAKGGSLFDVAAAP